MLRKLLAGALPVAFALVLVGSTTASAAPPHVVVAAGAVVGGGSISPGIPPATGPCPVTPLCVNNAVTFGGTIVGGGVHYEPPANPRGGAGGGAGSCSFSGGGQDSTLLASGVVSGSCSFASVGPLGPATVSCSALPYARVGSVVTVGLLGPSGCTVSITDLSPFPPATCSKNALSVSGVFVFVPTATDPNGNVTQYALAGAATLVGNPNGICK